MKILKYYMEKGEGEDAVFDYMKYVLVRRDRKNKIKKLVKRTRTECRKLCSGCGICKKACTGKREHERI